MLLFEMTNRHIQDIYSLWKIIESLEFSKISFVEKLGNFRKILLGFRKLKKNSLFDFLLQTINNPNELRI